MTVITETPETPEIPAVQVLDDTTDKTVTLPQSKLDEIIKKSMGRAASQVREENEQLRTENERLKTVVSGSGDADELSRTKGLLAEERLKNQAVLDRSIAQQKDLLISQEAAANNHVDVDTTLRLVRGNLRHDAATGSFTVVDDQGNPRLTPAGDPMSVSEFFKDFSSKKLHLIRGSVLPGTGSGSSTGSIPPVTKPLRFYFGPSSNAAAVNALSQRDPQTYKRLRAEAVRAGLVG
jgi:hypothetical protein